MMAGAQSQFNQFPQTKQLGQTNPLSRATYREFLMMTCSWPGERARACSLLIKVREAQNAELPPLIWCGGMFEMDTIAAICGTQRAVYGMRTSVDVVETTEQNIRQLGQYYANEIVQVMPNNNTFLLAGNCIGAFLIYEVATLLTQRGYKVGFLGIVDRDVTEGPLPLKLIRAAFYLIDTAGYTWHEIKNTKYASTKMAGLKHIGSTLLHAVTYISEVFHVTQCLKKLCSVIERNKASPTTATIENTVVQTRYQLKPYAGDVHLFFIRWGVFGFYQFSFYQQYWRKLIKGNTTVDIVRGHSHSHPNWSRIIKKLNQRIVEAGF